jgi:hypothetical protein
LIPTRALRARMNAIGRVNSPADQQRPANEIEDTREI